MADLEQANKLDFFLQWLKVNGAELRGCEIKYCDENKGFGIYSSNHAPKDSGPGILLVVPLDLAITPMRVLEDPLVGPECRSMLAGGEVDDRFLMMLFLTVERLRRNSTWKPYLDMLPTEFGNPLWFTDDDLLELKGTTLYRATVLQKKNLKTLFDEKVKKLAEKLLVRDGNPESEVRFEDFLWANSIFWTRALNIPIPNSYVFPRTQMDKLGASSNTPNEKLGDGENEKGAESTSQGGTMWIEGLVPGIDFCNHDLKAAATWEIDSTGSSTGVPFSMYLLSVENNLLGGEKEITISYGNKGNEELLYLYGFVVKDNTDDFLMMHYPMEAIQDVPFSEAKIQLINAQKGELRCLLPRNLLNNGFFPESSLQGRTNHEDSASQSFNYSWSGNRKMPSYSSKLVFPEQFLTTLRTITMNENKLYQVSSLLEELVGAGREREPSEMEVRTAVWEACGDSGALQLLVDLLNMKMMELEEGSGTEEHDAELLEKAEIQSKGSNSCVQLSRNKRASIVYRQGQKQMCRRFLREAEHALQLAMDEEK